MSGPSTAVGVQYLPSAADGLLQIRARPTGRGRLTLHLRGELDLMSAELLDGVLANYPARRYVRLEIGELSFIDGAGLRPIASEHYRLQDCHGELVLIGVGTRVRRLLSLAGLDHVLHTVASAPRL